MGTPVISAWLLALPAQAFAFFAWTLQLAALLDLVLRCLRNMESELNLQPKGGPLS